MFTQTLFYLLGKVELSIAYDHTGNGIGAGLDTENWIVPNILIQILQCDKNRIVKKLFVLVRTHDHIGQVAVNQKM